MPGEAATPASPVSPCARTPPYKPPTMCLDPRAKSPTHYELEFENPSSAHAQRLISDVEQIASAMTETSTVHSQSARSHSNAITTTTTSSHRGALHERTLTSSVAYGSFTKTDFRSSPERERLRSGELTFLHRVPEDGDPMVFSPVPMESQRSLQPSDDQGRSEDHQAERLATFGVQHDLQLPEARPPVTTGNNDEEEETDSILDQELAEHGLYRGSYHRLVSLYTLTPIFTILVFVVLACLPSIAYPLPTKTLPGHTHPYAAYLPFPLPELFTATAFWSLSYLLNTFIFSFASSLLPSSSLAFLTLSTLAQSTTTIILRQAVMPILLIPRSAAHDYPTWHDVTFRRVWWVSLGWAAAEAIVGIKQGYDGIALYRDVLVSVRRVASVLSHNYKQDNVGALGSDSVRQGWSGGGEPSQRVSSRHREEDAERQPLLERRPSISDIADRSGAQLRPDALEEEVERDVDELIALRGREELEDLYGMPFIHIPVFISCLHRFNSVMFVLGSTLFLTAAYMCSTLSLMHSYSVSRLSYQPPQDFFSRANSPSSESNMQLLLVFLITDRKSVV